MKYTHVFSLNDNIPILYYYTYYITFNLKHCMLILVKCCRKKKNSITRTQIEFFIAKILAKILEYKMHKNE